MTKNCSLNADLLLLYPDKPAGGAVALQDSPETFSI